MRSSLAAESGVLSSVRGLSPCPSPLMDERVGLVMSQWGNWQWRNRDRVQALGYPSKNPLSVDWGLGREGDFVYEDEMMPPLVELANQVLVDLKGPAQVFAWARWACPDSNTLQVVMAHADLLLPFDVKRVDVERWLSAIAGGVSAKLGDV